MPRKYTRPGDVLRHEFMVPSALSLDQMSRRMGVGIVTVERVLSGEQPITEMLAKVLSHAFGTTAGFWLNLQELHEDSGRSHAIG